MKVDDLISRIAARNPELQRDGAELGVKVIIAAISSALANGGRAEIRGFGSFTVTYKAPRTAKNPRNGKEVSVPAKHVPSFRAGKEFRSRVDCSNKSESGLRQTD
ncbi:MAG: HU family DNA-binding protein [Gallionella sp.]